MCNNETIKVESFLYMATRWQREDEHIKQRERETEEKILIISIFLTHDYIPLAYYYFFFRCLLVFFFFLVGEATSMRISLFNVNSF